MDDDNTESDSSTDSEGSRQPGENRVELEAYDLKVTLESEESSIDELTALASNEMNFLTRRALVGEYQELEEENLHTFLFG